VIYYLWSYICTLIYNANIVRGEFTLDQLIVNAMDQTPTVFELEDMVTVIVNLLYHIEKCVNAAMGSFYIGETEYKLVQKLLGIKPIVVKPIKESEIDNNVIELRLRLDDVFGLQNAESLHKISLEIYYLAIFMFKNQGGFKKNTKSKINFYS
jgi:hypothetical protein